MATAVAKPIEIEFFRLDFPSDFGEVLNELLDLGFRGTVAGYVDERTNQKAWAMEIVAADGKIINATLGEVFIWDGSILVVLTGDEFKAKYES